MCLRGGRRRVSCAALCLVALAMVGAGCGASGRGAETDSEKGFDAAFLNAALARELTALDAYSRALPRLTGRLAALGRRLRSQEQEYVDAITKAIRGLGGDTEAEKAELDLSKATSRAELLTAVYELEAAALASYIEAAPRLFTDAPRTLAVALAAGHAQHLVLLRQGLGTGLVGSVPEAFDGGEILAPGVAPDSGTG